MLVNIENYIENKLSTLKEKYKNIKNPTLYIFTDNKDGATASYKKSKIKIGEKIGVNVEIIVISTKEEMKTYLKNIEKNKNIGCILQLPFQNKEIVNCYMEYKTKYDVDGFFNIQEVFDNIYDIAPCTPKGIYNYIKSYCNDNIRNKHVVLIGRGNLTNKPLSIMMLNEGATVSIINSKTPLNIKLNLLKNADIIVCATGVKGSVKTSELSDIKNVLVFNCGIVFDSNGKLDTELTVDIEKENIDYTPRIKGVGLLTTYTLFENLYNLLYKNNIETK